MSQSYATARLYRKNYLKRKRGQQVEDRREGSIILQDTPIINANFILSDDSEIYDPTVNSWNEFRSPVDHPLFSQSEIQGCLDIGDSVYSCLYCGASFWLLERVEK
ncbi:hypothetical protein HN51_016631 [Arachis hypogaea]